LIGRLLEQYFYKPDASTSFFAKNTESVIMKQKRHKYWNKTKHYPCNHVYPNMELRDASYI